MQQALQDSHHTIHRWRHAGSKSGRALHHARADGATTYLALYIPIPTPAMGGGEHRDVFSTATQPYNRRMRMMQPRMADHDDRVTDIPADEADEQVLLQRLAQGDQIAFWAIWTLYRKDLFAYCLRWMGGNREEAEDALSSASLKAWKYLPAHAQDIVNVKAWLLFLLRNHCIDMRRALKRHEQVTQKMRTLPNARLAWQPFECGSPEDVVSRQEFLQDVRYAIDDLPLRLHETAEFRLVRNLSYREIATQLNLSTENARKRVQQARSILRMALAGDCPATPPRTSRRRSPRAGGNGGEGCNTPSRHACRL
jgi:RNA polymerase sigma factor (sigma-70 family)